MTTSYKYNKETIVSKDDLKCHMDLDNELNVLLEGMFKYEKEVNVICKEGVYTGKYQNSAPLCCKSDADINMYSFLDGANYDDDGGIRLPHLCNGFASVNLFKLCNVSRGKKKFL